MIVRSQSTKQSSGRNPKSERKAPVFGLCNTRLANPVDRSRDRHCQLEALQECSTCEAVLCDLHAQFCAICLAFFCEGCLDLHNETGDHADRNIGDLVATAVEQFRRDGEPGPAGNGVGLPDRAHTHEEVERLTTSPDDWRATPCANIYNCAKSWARSNSARANAAAPTFTPAISASRLATKRTAFAGCSICGANSGPCRLMALERCWASCATGWTTSATARPIRARHKSAP